MSDLDDSAENCHYCGDRIEPGATWPEVRQVGAATFHTRCKADDTCEGPTDPSCTHVHEAPSFDQGSAGR